MPRRGDNASCRHGCAERTERHRRGEQDHRRTGRAYQQDPETVVTSPLLKSVWTNERIEKAWRVVQENARTSTSETVRKEIADFEEEAGSKIRSLCHRLSHGKFEFGAARGIPVPKLDAHGRKTRKFRPIVLASVEARIVQRAVLDVLISIPALSDFINTPFSFGGLRKRKIAKDENKRDNPSAVPAAIKATLIAIGEGATYYASADIRSFFTRISKPAVVSILSSLIDDSEFIAFFEKAITTELSNMAELRSKANDFPIEEIGVAQGNSLSPLLGNIILGAFDAEMNSGDCTCLRYIDDFIILAPSAKAANARLRKATALLDALGMELSPEKSSKGAIPVSDGFTFLGIQVMPGIIRPAAKTQQKFISSISTAFSDSQKAYLQIPHGKPLKKSASLISTLKRVEGVIDGWGKHYWFCNDVNLLSEIDKQITEQVRRFFGAYRDVRIKLTPEQQRPMLGISSLAEQERYPFSYPKGAGAKALNPAATT